MTDLVTFQVLLFLAGTFAAALITGLAGFAFGLVAAAIWLYALSPMQATTLIVAYGLLVQGYAVWRLRTQLNAQRLVPLIVGSAIGVPLGILLLQWVPPSLLRLSVGVLLVLFSLYNLIRPTLPGMKDAGRSADAVAGVFNGLIGGSTGLAGIVIVIWSSMRGWQRDEQRAAFQPTGVATFLMTLAALGGTGTITSDVIKLFLLGLPVLALGTWAGWSLYGKVDEAKFRQGVLVLLLISGAALIGRTLMS